MYIMAVLCGIAGFVAMLIGCYVGAKHSLEDLKVQLHKLEQKEIESEK